MRVRKLQIVPKPEEIEDISFLRSGKYLNISFDLNQTNV